MKPGPKLLLNSQRPPNPPDPLAAARRKAMALQEKNRKDRVTMWAAAVIGGLGIAAVFAYLEFQQPEPAPKPVVAEVVFTPDAPEVVVEEKPKEEIEAPEEAPDEELFPEEVATEERVEEKPAEAKPDAAAMMAAEAPLLLIGMDASRDAAIQRDKDLFKRTAEEGVWDAYRGLLAKSIQAAMPDVPEGQGLNRYDPLWKEELLYRAILRWKVLGCFSQSQITARVTESYSASFLNWLFHNNDAMEEFLLTFRPEDDGGEVLGFLMSAWSMNEPLYGKYFPLAVACAVVFDRPMGIPSPIGNKEYEAESTVDPMKRYLWYVQQNEKGRLAAPVHHTSARDLVWTVCAPVTTAELDWAVRKMSLRRKNWGSAYGMVKYLMERAVEGENPYKEYSFEEILDEGGICSDQSYFCVNTARANGIPAMILTGETDLGAHAWAGLKIDDREWTTAAGRIGGVSKGQTSNPQTGAAVTEQEILHWNHRRLQSPNTTLSVWRHLWLADFLNAAKKDEAGGQAVRLAHRIGPFFTETWKALYTLLESEMELTGDPVKPSNLEEWKDFAKDMRREFKDNPRMAELAANAEMEYIFPYGSEGDAKRTLLRERRRINRDAGEQKDLIASSLKRQADLIHKRGGTDAKRDIGRLYDRALRDYGGSITGFKMMAEDYFSFMKDDPESAKKAARDIELAFKRVVETGTKNWFRANTESEIYRMICGYYRVAGEAARADMLERRYEVLLRRAKRSAL